MKTLATLTCAVALSLGTNMATAAVVFDSGAELADVNGGRLADVDASLEVAAPFTLTTAQTITSVQWSGFYGETGTPGVDDFTIRVYENAGGLPKEAPLASWAVGSADTRTDTGFTIGPVPLFEYLTDVTSLSLSAGSYWFSATNDTTANSDYVWIWGSDFGTGPGSLFDRTSPGGPGAWTPIASTSNQTFDFALSGSAAVVPLPTPILLLGAGLLGLFGVRRRSA